MRVLILGGGRFIGYHLVLAARTRGWQVTVFNDDPTPPLPEGIRWVRGDRASATDLLPMAKRRWDLVIDTWAGESEAVARSVALLRNVAERYCYVSSIAAGANALLEAGTYAHRKRQAETHVVGAQGGNLVIRFGLVLGPREYCGRLPWWLWYVARGRPIIAPGHADRPIRYHDVRDAAELILTAAQCDRYGLLTAAPAASSAGTIGSLLSTCTRVVGTRPQIQWVSDDQLLARHITPWTELPLWIPEGQIDFDAYDYNGDLSPENVGTTAQLTVEATWQWLQRPNAQTELENRPWLPYAEADGMRFTLNT